MCSPHYQKASLHRHLNCVFVWLKELNLQPVLNIESKAGRSIKAINNFIFFSRQFSSNCTWEWQPSEVAHVYHSFVVWAKFYLGTWTRRLSREVTSEWGDHRKHHPSLVSYERKGINQTRCWDKMQTFHPGSSASVHGETERKHLGRWDNIFGNFYIHSVCVVIYCYVIYDLDQALFISWEFCRSESSTAWLVRIRVS